MLVHWSLSSARQDCRFFFTLHHFCLPQERGTFFDPPPFLREGRALQISPFLVLVKCGCAVGLRVCPPPSPPGCSVVPVSQGGPGAAPCRRPPWWSSPTPGRDDIGPPCPRSLPRPSSLTPPRDEPTPMDDFPSHCCPGSSSDPAGIAFFGPYLLSCLHSSPLSRGGDWAVLGGDEAVTIMLALAPGNFPIQERVEFSGEK